MSDGVKGTIVSNGNTAMGVESPQLEAVLLRLLQVKAELDSVKVLYEEYDKLVLELRDKGFSLAIIGDDAISLVDNFAESNTSWKSCGVKRYDVKVESVEKREKRLAKRAKEES